MDQLATLELALGELRREVQLLGDADLEIVEQLRAVDGTQAREPRAEQSALLGGLGHRSSHRDR